MKRNEKLDELLKRWYAGETSDREADELRRTLLSRETDTKRSSPTDAQEQLDDDHAIDAMLFAGFRALAAERMPETARRAIADTLEHCTETLAPHSEASGLYPEMSATAGTPANTLLTVRTSRRPMHRIVGRAIAVAAVIACGIVLGLQLREPYCYIDGKPIYDRETALAATEYLDGLAALQLPEQILDRLLKN